MIKWGQLAVERLLEIAKISEIGPGVTRLPFTAEHRMALDLIESWMRDAGLQVYLDDAGTLIGRTNFSHAQKTLYLGSHQDSVRHGGAYDGIMGIALPILAITKLRSEGKTLPYNVEILAFADEEGVRFPTALIGSRALAGTFDPKVLQLQDRDGVSINEAMRAFGLAPEKIPVLKRDKKNTLGFLEIHIEQGPVLEKNELSIGVVSAICGIERRAITFIGKSGHAGTLPMEGRQDALVGASQLIGFVHDLGLNTEDLRATVGALDISPNVVNSVPGQACFTVELRAPDDKIRANAGRIIEQKAHEIAAQTGLQSSIIKTYAQPAQQCAEEMTAALADVVEQQIGRVISLSSGATHDASAMADLCDIAMLFVRCKDGVSHTPEEFVTASDMEDAIATICLFLEHLETGSHSSKR